MKVKRLISIALSIALFITFTVTNGSFNVARAETVEDSQINVIPDEVYAESSVTDEPIADILTLFALKGESRFSELTEDEALLLMQFSGADVALLTELAAQGLDVNQSSTAAYYVQSYELTVLEAISLIRGDLDADSVLIQLDLLLKARQKENFAADKFEAMQSHILGGKRFDEAYSLVLPRVIMRPAAAQDKPDVDKKPVAPFRMLTAENENISLNTGALTYEMPILSLPGISGLDVNVGITYNSQDAAFNKMEGGSSFWEVSANIGAGWTWDFSYIDTTEEAKILRIEGGPSYAINSDLTFKDHTLNDYILTNYTGFSHGGKTSAYKLTHKDGLCEYFTGDGKLIGKADRFGNTIRFSYDSNGLLTQITDTLNRNTAITYYDYGINNPYVVITSPDNTTVKLWLTKYNNRTVLSKITNAVSRDTTFTYSYENAGNSYYSKYYTNSSRIYANLISVTYPTQATTKFTYAKHNANLGTEGFNEVYKVSTRSDYIGATAYNYKTFSYGNNTGYPNYYATLPSGHTYTSSVTDQATKTATVRTFDYKHRIITTDERINGVKLTAQAFEYNSYDLPSKVTETAFSLTVAHSARDMITVTNYDSKGNVTEKWDPRARGNTASTDYKTTYAYDLTYSMLISEESRKDASTTIRKINTLSADKKTIASSEVQENGATKEKTDFTHDICGNMLTSTAGGIATTYQYDRNAYVSNVSVSGVRDADGNLITGSPGEAVGVLATKRTYTNNGRLNNETAQDGMVTSYAYDALGNVTSLTTAGETTTNVYDYTNNTVTQTDAMSKSVRYAYDALGRDISATDLVTGQVIWKKTYDAANRVWTESNINNSAYGQTTTYVYDSKHRPLSVVVTDKSGAKLSEERTAYDDAITSTTSKVRKTIMGEPGSPSIASVTYTDSMGNVVAEGSVMYGSEQLTRYAYDLALNRTSATDPRGNVTRWEYDYAGRVVKEINVFGDIAVSVYDTLGRKVSHMDFAGYKANPQYSTTYAYDNANRLVSQTSPFEKSGSTIYYAQTKTYYDQAGRVTLQKAKNNVPGQADAYKQTGYTYENHGFLQYVTSYIGTTPHSYTYYTYDKLGRMTAQYTGLSSPAPSGGSKTAYDYDHLGRMLKLTDAMGQVESYTYDQNGNMLTKTTRNGAVTKYTYDGLGRQLTAYVLKDGKTTGYVSSVYYLTGQLKSEQNDNSVMNYTYNELGLIATQYDGSLTTTYGYDELGYKTYYSVSGKVTTTYNYDKANRLTSVNENGAVVANYAYDVNGNRASLSYRNGNVTEYAYNLANLVTTLSNKKGATVLSSFTYAYLLDGNQVKKTDDKGVVTQYAYDGLGRLTQEWTPTQSYAYTYDLNNNRTVLTAAGAEAYATQYTYDANNRLTKTIKTSGSVAETENYYYDANCNQISKLTQTTKPKDNAAMQTGVGGTYEYYEYDGFDRMVSSVVDYVRTGYKYNPNGMRQSKTANGQTITHVWDGTNISLDIVGVGITKYIRGINLVASESGGVRRYYLINAHGDVVQLADASGNAVKRYDYDAFGVEKAPDANDANPFRYCGEYFDKETGTVYLRARYYDPVIGRFTQQDGYRGDPKDPLSLNLYTYCGNDPVSNLDPSGHAWYHWAIAAAVVAVAAVAVVATAGGAAPAIMAVASLVNGVAVGSAATTVAAGAFIGSSTVLGGAAFAAASNSKSVSDFNAQGNWGTVGYTFAGGVLGAASAAPMSPKTSQSSTSTTQKPSSNQGTPAASVHGNSKQSTVPQHGYKITDTKTNQTMKVGISGQPLNQNGTSPRANTQVNALNKTAGSNQYTATVLQTNIPGRAAALQWEKTTTAAIKATGQTLPMQVRPK